MDELQQSLERHFARTDQVGFERFPIWPNVRIIATLKDMAAQGGLGAHGGLRGCENGGEMSADGKELAASGQSSRLELATA